MKLRKNNYIIFLKLKRILKNLLTKKELRKKTFKYIYLMKKKLLKFKKFKKNFKFFEELKYRRIKFFYNDIKIKKKRYIIFKSKKRLKKKMKHIIKKLRIKQKKQKNFCYNKNLILNYKFKILKRKLCVLRKKININE